MRLHASAFVWVALAVPLPLGCARSAEERQLDSLRADIDRVQEDRDGTDLPALGPVPPATKASALAPKARAPEAGFASLEVVRVGSPDDVVSDDYADPEDTTPRPSIRIFGGGRGGRGRMTDDSVESFGTDEDPPARPSPLDPDAKRAYDAALSQVNSREYDKALESLAAFLVRWPDHPYADHAMYWRGECYFAEGDFARAAEAFQGVLSRFPAGAKAPDALLKLGICDQKLGRPALAKECFDHLVHDFRQTDAARHIPPAASGPIPEDHR